MPKLVEIVDDADITTKPLSRQVSKQSTKSVSSTISTSDVFENQSSAIGVTAPTGNISLNRTPSTKRESMISQNSTGGSDQESLIEQIETTALLSEQ